MRVAHMGRPALSTSRRKVGDVHPMNQPADTAVMALFTRIMTDRNGFTVKRTTILSCLDFSTVRAVALLLKFGVFRLMCG